MTVSLASLLVQETSDSILTYALGIASAIGVPVSTWQVGDPTRSLFAVEADKLSLLEAEVVGFISSGFLDYASGDWLTIGAKQRYNVDRPLATYATTAVTLTNTGGGLYVISANDLTFKNSTTGKTYHNTSGGTLASGPGTTLIVNVEADEAGSTSSASAGEIDTLVTTLLGVTCTNVDAAVGIDELDDGTLIQQCRDKLGSLSPNGPADAYAFVARNSDLTGTSAVTRVRVYSNSTTGGVSVYLAGPSGAVAPADVAAVQSAILTWATPLCATPTVASATAVTVNVTYTLWVYKSVNKTTADVQADVLAALTSMFSTRPIGGDIIPPATTGNLYASLIASTIRGVYPQAFSVSVTTPSSDVALTNSQVAALGTVTGTIVFVNDP